jgi:hypothetical protein
MKQPIEDKPKLRSLRVSEEVFDILSQHHKYGEAIGDVVERALIALGWMNKK